MWNISNLLAFLGMNIPTKQQPVYVKRRPTGAALRNPTDPVQAARIEAAAAKRERKADKLDNGANTCWHNNSAHDGRLSLYPFHVAH